MSMSEETAQILSSFAIGPRYQAIKIIGCGAYGIVIEAFDTETNDSVAIKKLNKIEDSIDAKRNLRELRCLKGLYHENILNLKDAFRVISPTSPEGDIYLVTDLMESDLHKVLKTDQPITDDHAQYFLYQLLKALSYMHKANLVHRDIKPSNILVNTDCDVKLCDFGLSRGIEEGLEDLTEYVVTRYYRAPEIMLSSHEYTQAVDIWSVGCTFGEILSRRVLFPGQNYIKQINLIIGALGTPDPSDLDFIANHHAKRYLTEMEPQTPVPIPTLLNNPAISPLAVDLLEKMLCFNPYRRISVQDALKHPYLAEYYEEDEDEDEEVSAIDLRFEQENLTVEEMKSLLFEDCRLISA